MKPAQLGSSAVALGLIICITIVVMRLFAPPYPTNESVITGTEADILDQLQRLQHRLDLLEMRCATSSSASAIQTSTNPDR